MTELESKLDVQADLGEQGPLTKWENEPKLSDLKQDLLDATPHHETHTTDIDNWLDNLNVTGSAKIQKLPGRSTVVPRLIRKQAEWRYASLSESFLSDENIFATDPVTWEDSDASHQNGLLLNWQFNNQLNKVNFIDDYVRTCVDEGTAVIRVGWDFREEMRSVPNMVKERILDPQLIAIIEQGMQQIMQDPSVMEEIPTDLMDMIELSGEEGVPTQMVQKGMKDEMVTVSNKPTIEVCDYNTVIIDPSCKGNMDKANFVIYRFETNLSELRKAGLYENLDQIQIEKTAIQNGDDYNEEDTGYFNLTDEPRRKFYAFEYWGLWDINGDGIAIPIIATWAGDTLIRMEESPLPRDEGLPFVLVQYLPKRNFVYGEPDGALLEENQKIAGAVTRGMLDILGRSAAGQTGTRKDALDITNQRRYDAGQDYSYNVNVSPKDAFYSHTYPEIPQSAPFMLNLVNMDAESMTGIKAFSDGGITGEGLGRSATAARSALDAASKREVGILRRLADGLIRVGRKIIAMNAELLSEEEVVRITNEEFVTIKRDDLAGRVDVKLNISTAETDNSKAGELAFMLQTMGNVLPMEFSQLVLEDIANLRKMPELAHKIKNFKPEPDPLQVAIQQAELRKLEAEIAKIESETAENYAEAGLDQAKTRDTMATAQRKDLDYVQEAEGVTHARELQKDKAQSEGNLTRDIVKEALKGGNGTETKPTP
jgi:hypothetical protein